MNALIIGACGFPGRNINLYDATSLIKKFTTTLKCNLVINSGPRVSIEIKGDQFLLSKNLQWDIKINEQIPEGDSAFFWAETGKTFNWGWKPVKPLETGRKKYVECFKAMRK